MHNSNLFLFYVFFNELIFLFLDQLNPKEKHELNCQWVFSQTALCAGQEAETMTHPLVIHSDRSNNRQSENSIQQHC